MELTYAQKGELTDTLLACPAFGDIDQRRAVVSRLPFGSRIAESARKDEHILKFVDECSVQPRGFEALIDAVIDEWQSLEKFTSALQAMAPRSVRWICGRR